MSGSKSIKLSLSIKFFRPPNWNKINFHVYKDKMNIKLRNSYFINIETVLPPHILHFIMKFYSYVLRKSNVTKSNPIISISQAMRYLSIRYSICQVSLLSLKINLFHFIPIPSLNKGLTLALSFSLSLTHTHKQNLTLRY